MLLIFACACGERTKTRAGLARPNYVVGILALAGNEAEVFLSAHRRADTRRAHGGLLPLIF